jgi:glyoxylase-like metal-dependent hydrolase (beta-lactamase superfamily II)
MRSDWFQVIRLGNGVTAIQEFFRPGDELADVKAFLIEGERDLAVLDTGIGVGDFAALVASLSDRAPIVLQSHAHWDHIGASYRFDRVLVHPAEADDLRNGLTHDEYAPAFGPGRIEHDRLPQGFDPEAAFIPGTEPTGWLMAGDRIDLGERVLEIYETSGHTPGGITILDRAARTLFPGDAINLGLIYLFAPNSDPAAWRDTLRRLVALASEVDTIRPSHGPAITPDDVRTIARAYDEVWERHKPPDSSGELDIGDDEPAHYDRFDYGRFSFLLAPGRYGAR